MSVLNYLRIHRVDQAEKQVRAMSTIDDDATITQLATACVNLFLVSLCCCPGSWFEAAVAEKTLMCCNPVIGEMRC